MHDIAQWLEGMGLGQFAEAFAENGVDPDLLAEITNDDLKDLGVARLADRKRILNAVAELNMSAEEAREASQVTDEAFEARTGEAERRQLTVMFCDLVGSTELSRRLDPEDLRDVIRRYQDAVAGAVARYEGHVARFLGDGVLTYFGWPKAYEDQAERAVRAGLDATTAVAAVGIDGGETLCARVGIATGQVVVGDLVGNATIDAKAVTGETPNLAARLQGVADPGQVVIGGTTRQLTGQTFELHDLGLQDLKGFSESVPAWGVVGESAAESRFEAVHAGARTLLVGREHELALLCERWELAKSGESQVVLLSGGAGIGKSRMVQALRNEIGDEQNFRLRYQCSPHHTNSAFHPVIRRLERAAGFSNEDSSEVKLVKLEALLRPTTEELEAIVPLFVTLLSFPEDGRCGTLDLTPQQLRDRTIEALIDQVLALSRLRPVLFVVEDAHWIDPSTKSLVGEIMARVVDQAIFLLITNRPVDTPLWPGHPHLTSIALNRLGRKQSAEIVQSVGGQDVTDAMVERIVARADGVPVYLEELTVAVVEGGLDIEATDIPATLQASLLARLDRLEDAREVAQISAVIGREFSYGLLAAVAGKSEAELNGALGRLVDSQLAFQRGSPPEATYTFKHALVQDAAYDSLLKRSRQELHRSIAEILERDFLSVAEAEPELLARHYTEAGLVDQAIAYWQQAGRRASERSANREAGAHISNGLRLTKELDDTLERAGLELDLLITLGPVLGSSKGMGAAEVGKTYLRARELCHQVKDTARLFTVTWGLWHHYQHREQLENAQALSAEVLVVAEQQSDPAYRLQAHHAAWTTLLFSGDLVSCRGHAENGITLYDIDDHRSHAFLYGGHDPGMCAHATLGLTLWFLGYPDKALEQALEAVTLAEKLSHPFSLVLARSFLTFLRQFRGEVDETVADARLVVKLCTENVVENYLAAGRILSGWAAAAQGNADQSIIEIREGIEGWRRAGTRMRESYYLTLLSETYDWAGQPERGLDTLEEALEFIDETGERRWEAEIYRLKGELLLSRSAKNSVKAEADYQRAIEVARSQEAKSLELRAATCLTRLWQQQGKIDEARDLLAPIYDWFSEGFDTADLKEAKTLLDELN
jgi:class 3 adenylate cyclase/predicted ATPase